MDEVLILDDKEHSKVGKISGVGGGGGTGGSLGGVTGAGGSILHPHQQSIERSENVRLLVSFVYFISCGTVCAYSVAFANDRMRLTDAPLRDLVFEVTSPQYWALSAAEVILIVQGALTLVMASMHKNALKIFRRFFFNFGTVYLLRAVCLFCTTLSFPGGDMECEHSSSYAQHIDNFLKIFFSAGISLLSNSKGYCGNYFFSGHTITITLEYLVIQDYTPKACYVLRKLSTVASFSAAVFLIISRGHYTIDVLAAYYVTTRLWWNYHAIALNQSLRNNNPRQFAPSKELWYPMIVYLEENSGHSPEINELCSSKLPMCSFFSHR